MTAAARRAGVGEPTTGARRRPPSPSSRERCADRAARGRWPRPADGRGRRRGHSRPTCAAARQPSSLFKLLANARWRRSPRRRGVRAVPKCSSARPAWARRPRSRRSRRGSAQRRGRRMGMVAADGFRAGAVEQLRIYADIIGAPFKVARTADELSRARQRRGSPCWSTPPGRSPHDPATLSASRGVWPHRGVRTHLVMAADTSPPSARRILDRYAASGRRASSSRSSTKPTRWRR